MRCAQNWGQYTTCVFFKLLIFQNFSKINSIYIILKKIPYFLQNIVKKGTKFVGKNNVVLIYSQYWTLENHLSIMI